MRVDHELAETQDFSDQMEGVTETRLLTLLSGKGLDGLQVEVVVEMKVVQALTMDQQVEHVVTLTADLQPDFDPVQNYANTK